MPTEGTPSQIPPAQQEQQNGQGNPPAQQPDAMTQILKTLEGVNNRLAQQEQYIQQNFRPAQQQPQGQADDEQESEYEDPQVKELRRQNKALAAQTNSIAERTDYLDFRDRVRELGLEKPDVDGAEAIFQNWKEQGMTFKGQPPSRNDALTYFMGLKAQGTVVKTRSERQQQEAQRIAENAQGFTERSGRRSPPPPDLSKMSRSERLTKGYAHLDEEGF